MKVYRFLVLFFVLVVLLLSCLDISNAKAADLWPKMRGELCWKTDAGDLLKVVVNNMGKGHYLLNGLLNEADGDITVVHGNAELVEDKIYATTTSAGGDAYETWTFIGRWVMDRDTLNGTIEIMGVYHDKSIPDHAGLDYDGPITTTFVPCP